MLIGLTYDLRSAYLALGYSADETAEFDREDTIDAIEGALRALGHKADRIGNARDLVARLLESYHQPVLVEQFLPGREFTVGIVGTGRQARVLGTVEVILLSEAEKQVYSYTNKEKCEELVEYRLRQQPAEPVVLTAEQIALAAWIALGCRDGGRVDLRCDEFGHPLFMEVNPLAGLHPAHSDLPIIAARLNIPYNRLIDWIVTSAAERVRPGRGLPTGQRRCA